MLNLFTFFFLLFNFTYSEDLLWRNDTFLPPVQISPNFILKNQNQPNKKQLFRVLWVFVFGFFWVFFFFACLFQISPQNLVISFISLGLVYN